MHITIHRITPWQRASRSLLLGTTLALTACQAGPEPRPVAGPAPAQPRSLAEVEIDGALTLTPDGRFELDDQARALFDHFIAAEGEVDEDALYARIRAEIDVRLPANAAEEAWEAFLAYMDYRREAAAMVSDEHAKTQSPAALAQALDEIRARTIGDAPGIPDEGAQLQTALELQATLDDPALDLKTRSEQAARLHARLHGPPDPNAPSRILARVRAALAQIPANDIEARRAALTELVDEAAAERWLQLERRRANALAPSGR
ncbi:MAG: hypothetical protein AAGF11_49310 [Myxococcota bacterium]